MAYDFSREGTANVAATATEYTLNGTSPETTPCTLQGLIGTSALAAGDELAVRVYEKVISGGTQLLVWEATATYGTLVLVLPALILGNGWDVKVIQTAGVAIGANLPFSLRTV